MNEIIKNAIENKVEKITITGNFGCGEETLHIFFRHDLKLAFCKNALPLKMISDLYKLGYACNGMAYGA